MRSRFSPSRYEGMGLLERAAETLGHAAAFMGGAGRRSHRGRTESGLASGGPAGYWRARGCDMADALRRKARRVGPAGVRQRRGLCAGRRDRQGVRSPRPNRRHCEPARPRSSRSTRFSTRCTATRGGRPCCDGSAWRKRASRRDDTSPARPARRDAAERRGPVRGRHGRRVVRRGARAGRAARGTPPGRPLVAVYCSPLQRTRETARCWRHRMRSRL